MAGTNRTNRAGLLMSVDRGRPEASGRRSKRLDWSVADVGHPWSRLICTSGPVQPIT